MDNPEHKLIRLLLNKEFYDENKHRVLRDMFPAPLSSIYDTIQEGHTRYDRDMTVDELKALHWIVNPTLTRAARENIHNLLYNVENDPTYGEDLGKDVLAKLWFVEVNRQITEVGVNNINGLGNTFGPIRDILDKHEDSGLPADDLEELDDDFDGILAYDEGDCRWKFNLPVLAERLPGAAGGRFMVIFARPEVGKTSFHVSLSCGPGGFVDQGATVAVMSNEEDGRVVQYRGVQASSGMNKEQILNNKNVARAKWQALDHRYKIIKGECTTMEMLDAYCKRNTPDILIIDQLDKIEISGTFSRLDQKLREVYRQAREISKRHDIFVIAISQASADAEDQTYLTYSMMDESRTGKAAEADVILGIGKREDPNQADPDAPPDKMRYLTVSKNKINGFHGKVNCKLHHEVSQYRD